MAGRWTIRAGLVLAAWLGAGLADAQAQILPVTLTGSPPSLSTIASSVTVSLSPADWLPRPGNSVTVTVNVPLGATVTLVALVCPDGSTTSPCLPNTSAVNPTAIPALRTSAYEGECTNFGSGFATDFTFNATTGVLTSLDCGGMAVIRVEVSGVTGGPFFFILPPDNDFDGMPNDWEAQFCTGGSVTCLDKLADSDPASVTSSIVGDGLAAIDEYRCCRVAGAYPRPRPDQKDLFLTVANPQCLPAADNPLTSIFSLLGGGTKTYPTAEAAALLANTSTITASSAQIHHLCANPGGQSYKCNEWVDNFLRRRNPTADDPTDIEYQADTDGATSDRQINRNRLYPASTPVQKGVRLIECVDRDIAPGDNDTIPTSPLGRADQGSPNLVGGGNPVIFTRRIQKHLNDLIDAGLPRKVRHLAFESGSWVVKFTSDAPPTLANRDYIVSVGTEYYLAMEGGHSLSLTPTVEGTRRVSYGFHHAPGTGSNLDQAIVNTVSNSLSGFNDFYIPFFFNSGDRASALYE